jgi:hypothetical protein
MIPPSSKFKISNYWLGFKQTDSSAMANIAISEMPFKFDSLRNEIDKPLMNEGKFRQLQIDTVINGYRFYIEKLRGPLFELSVMHSDISEIKDSTEVVKWFAFCEIDKTVVSIAGIYLAKDDSSLHHAFINSITSIKTRDSSKVKPMDALAFTIDLSDTEMKFASLILQVGGWFTNTGNRPMFGKNDQNYSVYFVRGLGSVIHQKTKEREKTAAKGQIVLGESNFNNNGLNGWEYYYIDTISATRHVLHYKAFLTGPADITFIINANSKASLYNALKWFRRMTITIVPKPI